MTNAYVVYVDWDNSEQYGALILGVAITHDKALELLEEGKKLEDKRRLDFYNNMHKYHPKMGAYKYREWTKFETADRWGFESCGTFINIEPTKLYD